MASDTVTLNVRVYTERIQQRVEFMYAFIASCGGPSMISASDIEPMLHRIHRAICKVILAIGCDVEMYRRYGLRTRCCDWRRNRPSSSLQALAEIISILRLISHMRAMLQADGGRVTVPRSLSFIENQEQQDSTPEIAEEPLEGHFINQQPPNLVVEEDPSPDNEASDGEVADQEENRFDSEETGNASLDTTPSRERAYLGIIIAKAEDERNHCAICLSGFVSRERLCILPCSHLYHPQCIYSWCLRAPTCPLCRMNVFSLPS